MTEYRVPVTVTADAAKLMDAVRETFEAAAPSCETSWAKVYRFPDHQVGDEVHDAIVAWLTANGVPVADTPWAARFVVTDQFIQIEQFDMHVCADVDRPVRTISLMSQNGFVKTERIFPLKEPINGFEPVTVMVAVA